MEGKTRMNTVDDFMKEANNLANHYRDGLIYKAEFISTCKFHLDKLIFDDLKKARRTIEQHGLDGDSFVAWINDQAANENV